MLRPRKNSLIDGPVVVSGARSLRQWRLALAVLLVVVVALAFAWPSSQPQTRKLPDEVWWRLLISNIAAKRLVHDVDSSAADQMKQRVSELESERIALTERLSEANQLLNVDRSQQRVFQVVARQVGGDIAYEILLRTPPGSDPGIRLSISVMAINNPSATAINRSNTLALDIPRSTQLAVPSPKVAETLQGRLRSDASHLLVMLSPVGDASETEALLVPVNRD